MEQLLTESGHPLTGRSPAFIQLFKESFAKIREQPVDTVVVPNVSRSFYLRIIKNTSAGILTK